MIPGKASLIAAAAALAVAGLAAPASAATRGDFKPVRLPFLWPENTLKDVAAASPDSVWIAGAQGQVRVPGGLTIPGNPVVRRWKGGGWAEYDLQGLPNHGEIMDVDPVAPEDVWISGSKFGDGNSSSPYLAHFTGSSFAQVALPAGMSPALQADASGVWVLTSTDVYRRTGTTWTHVTSVPDTSRAAFSIRADDDIWILGTSTGPDQSLIAQHWDGRSWQSAPMRDPVPGAGFTGIVALSPTDAWATGNVYRTSPNTPLLMHWDGAAWSNVTPPPGLKTLSGIAKGDDGTLWAIGSAADEPAKPGLIRYSGGTWERVPTTAAPGGIDIHPSALTVVPGTGALWTLGTGGTGGPVVLADG
ncbi:WD40/YVTN/BNR-like repeat-containing protein [Actinomadura verrucosospora]|uniref:Uncharacterized protein n=1 Tax=Actinomadura verrucosospora TaxID=46165 RepID=A0A7D3ZWE1_ACTVE|nr:hypothetical protein [Actinomadura verrucosospora]QKG20826.1 hypothetical protein ACTIVE_2464 [Actinomadura verrucosospora]